MGKDWKLIVILLQLGCQWQSQLKQRSQLLWALLITACKIIGNYRNVILPCFTKIHVHVHEFQVVFLCGSVMESPKSICLYTCFSSYYSSPTFLISTLSSSRFSFTLPPFGKMENTTLGNEKEIITSTD